MEFKYNKSLKIASICAGVAAVSLGVFIWWVPMQSLPQIIKYSGSIKIMYGISAISTGIFYWKHPFVKIDNTTLTLRTGSFSKKEIDLLTVKVIEFNREKKTLKFDGFKFDLVSLDKNERERFAKSIKAIRLSYK